MAGKFWGMQVRQQRIKDGYHIRSSYDGNFLVYKIIKDEEAFIQSFSWEEVNAGNEPNFLKNFKDVVKKITGARISDVSITNGVKKQIENAIAIR